MKYLLVIDMQNDFISQALGTPEAPGIVEPVCRLIRGFDGDVIYTRDTHRENYLETQEGGKLPVPHCIEGTAGWQICENRRPRLYLDIPEGAAQIRLRSMRSWGGEGVRIFSCDAAR